MDPLICGPVNAVLSGGTMSESPNLTLQCTSSNASVQVSKAIYLPTEDKGLGFLFAAAANLTNGRRCVSLEKGDEKRTAIFMISRPETSGLFVIFAQEIIEACEMQCQTVPTTKIVPSEPLSTTSPVSEPASASQPTCPARPKRFLKTSNIVALGLMALTFIYASVAWTVNYVM